MPGRLWRIVVLCVIVPLVVLPGALHLLALIAIESPERVCSSCHATKSAIEKWKISNHHGVTCAVCHAPARGVLARETAILDLLTSCVRAELTGTKQQTVVPKRVCLQCHSSFYDVRQPSSCKFVSHAHDQCASCHRGLVHGVYDRDAVVVALRERGQSVHVGADFPHRLREKFSDKDHFQHGFQRTMAFCGRCHRMAPSTATTKQGRALPRSPVCETCHIRY